jgi:hypothetical protein
LQTDLRRTALARFMGGVFFTVRNLAKKLPVEREDHNRETMPSQRYKDHLLISIARYDSASSSWMFKVNISWWEKGTFNYHIIDGPAGLDKTEEEAIAHGFSAGQEWIDDRQQKTS